MISLINSLCITLIFTAWVWALKQEIAKTMAAIERCRRHGLDFQLHFSVTEQNAQELAAMIEFAKS